VLEPQFWEAFWPSFWATVFGVLLSIVLSVLVWYLRRNYEDKNNRRWVKNNLRDELINNLKNLRNIQNIVAEAATRGVSLGQFFPFYMILNVYNTSLSTGYIRLLTPLEQSKVHGVASYMQMFNTLLANVEAFAVHNLSSPSFRQELKLRCDALAKQAEVFAKEIEETLSTLGIRFVDKGNSRPELQIVDSVVNVDMRSAHSAVLELVNEGATPGEIGLRAKGEKTEQTYHLEPGGRAWAVIPLVEGKFQANVSNVGCKIYLRGYMRA
jgi:ABC-type multidrug transport system fused ATPase/permease subunit